MKKIENYSDKLLMFEVARLRTLFKNNPEIKDRIVKRYKLIVDEYNSRNLRWYWSKHKLDQLIKDEFQGHKGKWVTLENGQHIFIREGESLEEATERLREEKPKTEEDYIFEIKVDEKLKDSKKYKERVLEIVDELPENEVRGVFYIDIKEDMGTVEWNGHIDKARGSYDAMNMRMTLDDEILFRDDAEEVIYHEFGHGIYSNIETKTYWDWNSFWEKNKNIMPNDYSKISNDEGFAECYQLFRRKKLSKEQEPVKKWFGDWSKKLPKG